MRNFKLNDDISQSYESAKKVFKGFGVETDKIVNKMNEIEISLHCWQGDDVGGFETGAQGLTGGGIMATGNYPGKARNGDELRRDMEKALSLIPGKHRINLHASYAETNGKKVERDELSAEHFSKWIDWAKKNKTGVDFNPTFYAHRMADSGYTLSSKDKDIRSFWIRHAIRSREIAAEIGKELGNACVNDIWIPDGSKDIPADRGEHRRILRDSLDEVLKEKFDKKHMLDAVESKLFGLGSESYVVGSHEFYMGYAVSRGIMLCLDAGHFHPTESIADKISSILAFSDGLLLHMSRGVRWDSDHVAILSDELLAIAQEVIRNNALERIHIALDYFDASINRITAWVTGARAVLKAMMIALLEPVHLLLEEENTGNLGNRLALMEEIKMLPFGAVWNRYCRDKGVPVGPEWIESIEEYEKEVLAKRIIIKPTR